MQTITIKNFRAFGSVQQTCRLAPLTLLVGENSTGKTSFMALIRAMWDIAYAESVPNFVEMPYDLGSFDNIVHHEGNPHEQAPCFEAFFTVPRRYRTSVRQRRDQTDTITFGVKFEDRDGVPFPTRRRIENTDSWIQARESEQSLEQVIEYSSDGKQNEVTVNFAFPSDERELIPFRLVSMSLGENRDESRVTFNALRPLLNRFRAARGSRVGGE